jgi:eukaryotic-like serine/threonine-protein kinase
MPAASAKEFGNTVRESKLVSDDRVRSQIQKLYASAGDAEPTAQQLAVQMLEAHLLTKYQASHLLAGRTQGFFFENYVVLDRIGRGSMGKVYKAKDRRLGRHVALKILRRDLTNTPKLVARFKREGSAGARLEHPNVVRTYDLGKWRDLYYIVFEYIEGVNLKALLRKKGKLRPSKAIDIVLQVADALEHARINGVVHRDLKPSNIMLTRDGQAKVLDMGLARIISAEGQAAMITQVGEIVGTFDYIAPEQAIDTSSADTRSDLYSLGCTLFHMVTGQAPYPEGTALDKITRHQEEKPPRPTQLEPAISEELDAVILKLMAKNPADRYQTPTELGAELANIASSMSQYRVLSGASAALDVGPNSSGDPLGPPSSIIPRVPGSSDFVVPSEIDSGTELRTSSSTLMAKPEEQSAASSPRMSQRSLNWTMLAIGTLIGVILALIAIFF